VVATTAPDLADALTKATDHVYDSLDKSFLPSPLSIVRWISCIVGFLLFAAILGVINDEEESISLSQAYSSAAWAFWLCGTLILVFLVLTIIEHRKTKKILNSDEHKHTMTTVDSIMDTILTEFGIPSDAPEVDILTFRYKMKNDVPVAKEMDFSSTPYDTLIFHAYADASCLYLVNAEEKNAFLLSEMRAIRTINKRIMIPDWNKDNEPKDKIYKPYKLTVCEDDAVSFKPYHILELEHDGKLWGIYFPCYELPVFEKLTGLKAE